MKTKTTIMKLVQKEHKVMTSEKIRFLEDSLNETIIQAANNGGHIWIVDKRGNTFAIKITAPIKIQVYAGYKGD